MSSDVKAKKMTATGAMSVGPARIKAISFLPIAAGNISIKDGGSSGTEVLSIDVSADSGGYVDIPCDGVRCTADPYLTLTAVTSVTIFYA